VNRLTLIPVFALLALVAGSSAALGSAKAVAPAVAHAIAAGPSTFSDTAGDSGTAADITTVIVNNDANGQITLQVNVAGALTNTEFVDIFIDSDQNQSTGDPKAAGAEYDFYVDESKQKWFLESWNGSSWEDAKAFSTASVNPATNQVTFSINRSGLGVTSGFNAWVDSSEGTGGPGHEDQAPDSGTWNYQLSTPTQNVGALHLTVLALVAAKTAQAGKNYWAGMAVQRSDTTGFLGAEGQIECKASLGGKNLATQIDAFVTFKYHGTKMSGAYCLWRLPTAARGKTLRGAITASYQGAQVTRKFSATIK
jgi:hypothetical protein